MSSKITYVFTYVHMYLVIDRCTCSTRRTLVKLVPLHCGVQYTSIGRARAQFNIDFV